MMSSTKRLSVRSIASSTRGSATQKKYWPAAMYYMMYYDVLTAMIEGSLEVKLPTIWTDEKQSREETEGRERLEERRVEEKE